MQDKAQEQLFRGNKEGETKEQVMPHFSKADILHFVIHGIINAKYKRGGILFQSHADIIPTSEIVTIVATDTSKTIKRSVADYHKITCSIAEYAII